MYHNFSVGPKSDEGDYILDHSIVIYLINPNGVYQNHFMDRSKAPQDIYAVIRQQFDLYEKFNNWNLFKILPFRFKLDRSLINFITTNICILLWVCEAGNWDKFRNSESVYLFFTIWNEVNLTRRGKGWLNSLSQHFFRITNF